MAGAERRDGWSSETLLSIHVNFVDAQLRLRGDPLDEQALRRLGLYRVEWWKRTETTQPCTTCPPQA